MVRMKWLSILHLLVKRLMQNRIRILLVFLIFIINLSLLRANKVIYTDDLIEVQANQQDRVFAQDIMEHLPKLIDRFQMDIGVYPQFKARIYLSHDQQDFQNIVATFGGITEHSNAFYSRQDSVIYIKSFLELGNKESFYQILHHEYIHAFIEYHFKDAPLWFHEGMAIHFSQQFSTNMVYALGVDYLSQAIPSINEMENKYPQDSRMLTTFYAKSAMAVEYLHKLDKLAFSKMFTTHKYFNIAFNRSFGFSKEKFYYDFEKDFREKIILNAIYSLATLLGLVFPIIFIWGWIRRAFIRSKISPIDEDDSDDDVIITL